MMVLGPGIALVGLRQHLSSCVKKSRGRNVSQRTSSEGDGGQRNKKHKANLGPRPSGSCEIKGGSDACVPFGAESYCMPSRPGA